MKNVLITGATGMVGNNVLKQCLQSNEVNAIRLFSRSSLGIKDKRVKEVIVDDFLDYAGMDDLFKNIDIVYFCLGVYTGQVPDKKFKEITMDFTRTFGELLKKYSPAARFCFLSGAGADRSMKSRFAFAKYKGMAENYLIDNFEKIHSFRPAYIYPVEKRKEPNFTYSFSRLLYPVIRLLGPGFSVKSTELAEAMFKVGLKGSTKSILENKAILSVLKD